MNTNKIIQGLWIHGPLKQLHKLTICSFLANGHEFHLYTYDNKINSPQGTIIKSANEIILENEIFTDTRDGLTAFSDRFRYELLYQKGGWWVDMDMICLKAFDFESDYVFSSEHGIDGETQINIGAIKVPSHSDVMLYCKREAQEIINNSPNIEWGMIGISLLDSYIRLNNEYRLYVQLPHVFCPIPYNSFHLIFSDMMIDFTKKTYGVHLWNEMLRLYQMDSFERFHQHSFFERAKRKYLN